MPDAVPVSPVIAAPDIAPAPPAPADVPEPAPVLPVAAVADASPAPVVDPVVPAVDLAPPAAAGILTWEAVATVDPSLYVDPDPQVPCPTDEPERVFPLDLAEILIGRRSDRRDIHPEIPLNDPGVSHRHAKLLRQPDGSFALLDVGSTNGTQVNGNEVAAGVRTPLVDDDQVTVGCWTRITIHGRQA